MLMKKCAVLGLGVFGRHVAMTLSELGHDVLAMDLNSEAVDTVSDKVAKAVIADASEKESLVNAGVHGVDVAIIGVGTKIDASTLATLHLRELGVETVIAKAVTMDHAKVLAKVGATEIIHPEGDMAKKLAAQLVHPNIVEELPFFEGYALYKIHSQGDVWGKSISESNLRANKGIAVVAIERIDDGEFVQFAAKPESVVLEGDILIVFSSPINIKALNVLN